MIDFERFIPSNLGISREALVAMQAAKAAGSAIIAKIGGRVNSKEGMSNVVNDADFASGAAIRELLGSKFPNDPILSEEIPSDENAEVMLSLPRLWVVDELDGSKNFADGIDNVWVSISFAEDGIPIVAVCYNPFKDVMYFGQRGKGAYFIGPGFGSNEWGLHRLSVSGQQDLSKATMETSISYDPDRTIDHQIMKLALLFKGITPRFREIGSTVEQLCRVAAGISDLHFHTDLEPWDYAGGVLMIEEAGGTCKRLDGSPFSLSRRDNVSGNSFLVDQFIRAIRIIYEDKNFLSSKFAEELKKFKL